MSDTATRERPDGVPWRMAGEWGATFQSGTPLNVTIQGDRANTGIPNQRPDLVSEVELDCQPNPSGPGLVHCIDPTALAGLQARRRF